MLGIRYGGVEIIALVFLLGEIPGEHNFKQVFVLLLVIVVLEFEVIHTQNIILKTLYQVVPELLFGFESILSFF